MTALLLATAFCADLLALVAANGYHPFPIPSGSKGTFWRGWQCWCRTPPTAEQVAHWTARYPAYGIALACGHACFAIDIDEESEALAERLTALVIANLGETPLVRIGRWPRRVLIYRVAAGAVASRRLSRTVELIGDGRYVVAFGIHPDTALPYRWLSGGPDEVPVSAVPAPTADRLDALAAAMREVDAHLSPPDATAPPVSSGEEPEAVPGIANLGAIAPTAHLPAKLDPRWTIGPDGRVCDGRDWYLTVLTARAVARGIGTPAAIAKTVWAQFKHTADLTRPKRDGRRPWGPADALAKAESTARRGHIRPGGAPIGSIAWAPHDLAAFSAAVDAVGAQGRLSPCDVRVSHAMAAYLRNGARSCFASPRTLATTLGIHESTVKKARRRLVASGLWLVSNNRGGPSRGADYVPNREAVPVEADAAGHLGGLLNRTHSDDPNLPVGG